MFLITYGVKKVTGNLWKASENCFWRIFFLIKLQWSGLLTAMSSLEKFLSYMTSCEKKCFGTLSYGYAWTLWLGKVKASKSQSVFGSFLWSLKYKQHVKSWENLLHFFSFFYFFSFFLEKEYKFMLQLAVALQR